MRRTSVSASRSCSNGRPASARFSPCLIAGVLCLTFGTTGRSADDRLDPTLARARAFVATWKQELAGVVLEEDYVQHVDRRFEGGQTLRLRSDVLLVRVKNDWVGFRDIAEIDGQPIAGRKHDEAAQVWVPVEMVEEYRTPQEVISCRAKYGNVRRFTVSVSDDLETSP